MYLTKEIKEEIFAQHGEKTNTGKLKLKLLCSLSELAI
jgi:small subunit ribosomal protein S15